MISNVRRACVDPAEPPSDTPEIEHAGPVSLYGMVEEHRCAEFAGLANQFGALVLAGRSGWLVSPALRPGMECYHGNCSLAAGVRPTLGRRYGAHFILRRGAGFDGDPPVLFQAGRFPHVLSAAERRGGLSRALPERKALSDWMPAPPRWGSPGQDGHLEALDSKGEVPAWGQRAEACAYGHRTGGGAGVPHGEAQRCRRGAPGRADGRAVAARAPGRESRSQSVETPCTVHQLIYHRKREVTHSRLPGSDR